MTDNPKLDELNAEIVKTSEALYEVGRDPNHKPDVWDAALARMEAAVAAKRVSLEPKPLSAEEAANVWQKHSVTEDYPPLDERWGAVLTEAARRWLKVIDHALDTKFPGGGNSHERAMREEIRRVMLSPPAVKE